MTLLKMATQRGAGWRLGGLVAVVSAAILVMSACGDTEAASQSPTGSDTPAATQPMVQPGDAPQSDPADELAADASESDFAAEFAADASDVGYWSSGFAIGEAALEGPGYHPLSLDGMTNAATVVILGRAIGPGPSYSSKGDPDNPEDVTGLTSIRVEVLKVLAGELEANSGSQEIVVTAIGTPRGPTAEAPAVLFLRHNLDRSHMPPYEEPEFDDPRYEAAYQEQHAAWLNFAWDKYRLVSSHGIFVEVDGLATNPARPRGGPIADSVRELSLAEVIAEIESAAGHPELAATDFGCCSGGD